MRLWLVQKIQVTVSINSVTYSCDQVTVQIHNANYFNISFLYVYTSYSQFKTVTSAPIQVIV